MTRHAHTRAVGCSLALGFAIVIASPAHGDPTPTPSNTWVTGGAVTAVVRAGDYLFVGGDFGGVSPADRHTGPFAVFVPPSEIPLPLPPIRGESAAATAVVDDGQGGLIVGGQFAVAGPVTLCLLAPTTCAP